MERTLLVAVLAGLSGMLGWGFADFFAKKTIDKVGDMATLAWAHIYGVTLIGSIVLARTFSEGRVRGLPNDIPEMGKIAFFGALQALVYLFVYRGFGKGKLALLNPVFSSYSGFVVLASVLFFGEVMGAWQLAVLAVVFIGIISISLDHESFKLRKLRLTKIAGLGDILSAVTLAALWTVLWGHFVSGKDWLMYAALMYAYMSLTVLFLCWIQRVKLNVLDAKTLPYFMLIGITEVAAYIGISIGYSLTIHTSVVAVLSAAFSVPTLILAHVFLKEHITKLQLVGVVLVIVGVTALPLV